MKRTGGQRTDELLRNRGGGPEGLPDSIIVTPEGIEGEAPVLPDDQRTIAQPESPAQEEKEPALPMLARDKIAGASKGKRSRSQQKSGPKKGRAQEQAVLPFVEKTGTRAKRTQKTGKNHGAKKTKK
jgi:DNA topoisomerase VI subunit B